MIVTGYDVSKLFLSPRIEIKDGRYIESIEDLKVGMVLNNGICLIGEAKSDYFVVSNGCGVNGNIPPLTIFDQSAEEFFHKDMGISSLEATIDDVVRFIGAYFTTKEISEYDFVREFRYIDKAGNYIDSFEETEPGEDIEVFIRPFKFSKIPPKKTFSSIGMFKSIDANDVAIPFTEVDLDKTARKMLNLKDDIVDISYENMTFSIESLVDPKFNRLDENGIPMEHIRNIESNDGYIEIPTTFSVYSERCYDDDVVSNATSVIVKETNFQRNIPIAVTTEFNKETNILRFGSIVAHDGLYVKSFSITADVIAVGKPINSYDLVGKEHIVVKPMDNFSDLIDFVRNKTLTAFWG